MKLCEFRLHEDDVKSSEAKVELCADDISRAQRRTSVAAERR
jgi:hypothetical protein